MNNLVKWSIFYFLLFSITACASVQQSTVRTKHDYKQVWNACIASVADISFSVSSTDPASGLIIADQAVMGGTGKVSRLNIQLFKALTSTNVSVKFIPPPGTMGGGGTADGFIEALKQRIPDIEPIVENNGNSQVQIQKTAIINATSEDLPKLTSAPSPPQIQSVEKKNIPTIEPQNTSSSPASMVVIGNKAKIRKKPSTKADIVKTIKKGEVVQVIKQDDEWFQIELASGDVGWCHKSVLERRN